MKSTDTSYCTELYVSEQSVVCMYHSAKSATYRMLQASYLTRVHQNFCECSSLTTGPLVCGLKHVRQEVWLNSRRPWRGRTRRDE